MLQATEQSRIVAYSVKATCFQQACCLRATQGDVFTNNALGLTVELPATLVAIWLLNCAGRKKTTLAFFLILGWSVLVA